MSTPDYTYQVKGIAKAGKWFEKNKTFRISAIVGSGKTVIAGAIANTYFAGKNVVVLAHTNNLVKQLTDAFYDEVPRLYPTPGQANFRFSTRQAMSKCKKRYPEIDLLIVDEVHQGGLESLDSDVLKSYERIIEHYKPKNILAMSATDYGVNGVLFGDKNEEEGTLHLGYFEGIEHGIVNEIELSHIHVGIDAVLANIQAEITISGNDLNDIRNKLEEKGIDVRDEEVRKKISISKAEESVNIYLKKHAGEQAVFFVNTKEEVKLIEEAFERQAPKIKMVALLDDKKDEDRIEAFKAGELQVIANCRKLQEGFNLPSLAIVFDLSPSVANEARVLLQRIGRVSRVQDGKKTSRYYIINSLPTSSVTVSRVQESFTQPVEELVREHVAQRRGNRDEVIEDSGTNIAAQLLTEQVREGVGQSIEIQREIALALNDGEAPESMPAMEYETIGNSVVVSGFIVRNMSGRKEMKHWSFNKLLKEAAKKMVRVTLEDVLHYAITEELQEHCYE